MTGVNKAHFSASVPEGSLSISHFEELHYDRKGNRCKWLMFLSIFKNTMKIILLTSNILKKEKLTTTDLFLCYLIFNFKTINIKNYSKLYFLIILMPNVNNKHTS